MEIFNVDPQNVHDSLRNIIFVSGKVVTDSHISDFLHIHPVEAIKILADLYDLLKAEGRHSEVICSYVLCGYLKDSNPNSDLMVFKILEVDEDEVENSKNAFTDPEMTIRSIRMKDVDRHDQYNYPIMPEFLVKDMSDLEIAQRSCPVVAEGITIRKNSPWLVPSSESRVPPISSQTSIDSVEEEEIIVQYKPKAVKKPKKKNSDSESDDDVEREGDLFESDVGEESPELISKNEASSDEKATKLNGQNGLKSESSQEVKDEPLKENHIKNGSANIGSGESDEEEPVARKTKKTAKKADGKKRKRIMIFSDSEEEKDDDVEVEKPVRGRRKKNIISSDEDEKVEEKKTKKPLFDGKVKATGPYDPQHLVEDEEQEEDEDGFLVTKKVKKTVKGTSTVDIDSKSSQSSQSSQSKKTKAAPKSDAAARKITDFFSRPK